ncbi:pyridoxal phosphate-dependent aminotransferase [Carboxydothermus pertinax]|uniref:Aminotransferase n=1 Tax=Carboxydothermus pertinax TaxID=870242 RepID=A0A1L8CXW1_9THEO|nr:pyridoxal phosphate-dependent aminotransferase [Carboxydothermus pertinax]GAV23733.1 aspartate aminotransferase [Carboxydothermus pertinax]
MFSERAKLIGESPTLAIDKKAKELINKGEKVINFGVGEPDFDTPEYIKEAAINALKQGKTKYTPVGGISELREKIAEYVTKRTGLKYEEKEVVVTCGAKHGLYNIFQILLNPGDEVLIPVPYWVSYVEQVKLAGGIPVFVPTEENFKLRPDKLKDFFTPKTKAIILNSPSNPTGVVYSFAELKKIGQVIKNTDIYVIADEIYERIYFNAKPESFVTANPELKEKTFIVNGFSKSHSMTGWRLGYVATASNYASKLIELQSHQTSNPTSFAQWGALAALNAEDEKVEQMVKEFKKRRDYVLARLQELNLKVIKPEGAFYIFPQIDQYFGKKHLGRMINSSTDFAQIMLEYYMVAMVPGIAFGDDRFVRLSYALSLEDIKEGLDRLAKFLTNLE